jgi:anti-sigma factor RsiW
MNKQQHMEERLWDYLDGACSSEERMFIERLIATNHEWKNKYQELLELQDLLSHHLELDEPSMRFNQNIMEAISQHHIAPAAKSYINKRIIWGIAGFFICTITAFLIAGIAQVDWSAATTNDSFINLSKLDRFANSTYSTIFMMINIVLGLMLLDMYLRKRKTEVANKK